MDTEVGGTLHGVWQGEGVSVVLNLENLETNEYQQYR
jgi:hypothetical protein